MKTAVIGEGGDGHIIYNRSLLALAQHYGFHPKACRPYRAKTKGKVERPFRYYPRGLFPRPFVPQSRRPERSALSLACGGGNPARACDDAARRQRGLCRGKARAPAFAAGAVPRRAQARTAGLA